MDGGNWNNSARETSLRPVVRIIQNPKQNIVRVSDMIALNGLIAKGTVVRNYRASIVPKLLDGTSGIVVLGGRADVDPIHYKKKRTPYDGQKFDPRRDRVSLPLIREAIKRGVPVLAICRGIQELNVAQGGSLRNIKSDINHLHVVDRNVPESNYGFAHWVTLADYELCRRIYGNVSRTQVNSLHRQAIDELGDGLEVLARADDGCIEMVTMKPDKHGNFRVIGMQSHPDKKPDKIYPDQDHSSSDKVFVEFGKAVRAHHKEMGRPVFVPANVGLSEPMWAA